jgi:RNA polymerase sigma factor (sigma-70 family)
LNQHPADDLIRAALRRDDSAACELLWDRFAGDLFVLLQALLGSRHDAEDVLQMVFVRIVRKRHYLAGARCLDAYVYRMAHHEAMSFLRRQRRRRPSAPDARSWLATEPATTAPEEIEALQAALARLPAGQREIVVLKIYRDKTFREIAALLQSRATHGAFPPALDALGLEDIGDPFSGKPLLYRLEGQGFLLYSVAEDQKDNGGTPKPLRPDPDPRKKHPEYDQLWRFPNPANPPATGGR